MFKYPLSLALCMAFHCLSFAQNSTLSRQQIQEDYEILYQTLVQYHPKPFLYTSEADLEAFYTLHKANLPEQLSEMEFQLMARKLVAQIKCGHTYAKPSAAWYESVTGKNAQVPFAVKLYHGSVCISNTSEGDFAFKPGDQLLALNGRPVAEILKDMYAIQERDGTTNAFVEATVEARFRLYTLWLYGMPDSFDIDFASADGQRRTTRTGPASTPMKKIEAAEFPVGLMPTFENEWSSFRHDSTMQIAYLDINSFSDRKENEKYYDKVFKHLHAFPQTQLIIDLRDNGGGYFGHGNHLLTYLTPEKFELNFERSSAKLQKNEHTSMDGWSKLTKLAFNLKPAKYKVEGLSRTTFIYKPDKYQFAGKVHVITNGRSFSQAALVAAHLKAQGALFYGSETGGTELGTNGILNHQLILPNSQVEVTIPFYSVISNSPEGTFGLGVQPDFPFQQAAISDRDEVLEYVIRQVSAKN